MALLKHGRGVSRLLDGNLMPGHVALIPRRALVRLEVIYTKKHMHTYYTADYIN